MPKPLFEFDNDIDFETIRFSLSIVRKARTAINGHTYNNKASQDEVSFHLGCAEIALLRLLLEDERHINSKDIELDS